MNAFLPGMETERRSPELSQWYTPPSLATKVWAWANKYIQHESVLEPAAGQGALVKPIVRQPYSCDHVVAIDIDAANCQALEDLAVGTGDLLVQVTHADFLEMFLDRGGPLFDLALMNPPYEDGKAEAFILHALAISKRVVGIFKASILHGATRYQTLWSQAHVLREVRLMSRPRFGAGEHSESAKSDFVVLEIFPGVPPGAAPHCVFVEMWP